MEWFPIAGLCLMSIFLLVLSGFLFSKPEFLIGLVVFMLGMTFSVVAIGEANNIANGKPMISIIPGEYKVAFVHIAGDNVNIGIERMGVNNKTKVEIEHLYLYQFNKNAFEGNIKDNARKLIVIESGEFKKLQLE